MKVLWSILGMLVFTIQLQAQCLSGNCRFGYGKKKFKSGAIYEGQFKNGQIHGKGKVTYSDGSVYIGEWVNNVREGKGKLKFQNGDLYKGGFVDNKLHGQGKVDFVNGDKYNGSFKADMKDGYGEYAYSNGDVYKGYFAKDVRHGEGTMRYRGGSEYKGNWANDSKNGKGTYTDENGNVYDGDWKDGEYVDASETTTPANEGGGKLDDFNLPGQSSSSSSNTSSSNTSSTNVGTSTNTSSTASLPDCNSTYCDKVKGVYVYSDGSRYIGEFKKGKPGGQGTIQYMNGDKYTGGWKNHAPNGKGFMTYSDGRTLAAEWDNGRPVRPLNDDSGIIQEEVVVDRDSEVKVWAVVVGVGRYKHMQTLKYTDDDAYRMYAFLKSPAGGAIPDNQIAVLIDEDATRAVMLRKMREVFLKADENDVVMLYFSGHGLRGSFVPSDYNGFNNLVQHTEVTDIFKQSKAKHKIVLADACHSGSMLAMRSANSAQATISKYYEAFSDVKGGTALLLSSKSEETSLEDSGLRQGVFSHFLMRGMKGEADTNRNKIVTIQELYTYVRKKVVDYTAGAQTPNLSGSYDNKMPVAVID